jgi:hypothetical protein
MMPLFYFHICDAKGFVEDEEGRELADAAAARAEAVTAAREIMAHELREGLLVLSSFIEVEDSQHKLLFTISFKDLVDIDERPLARPPRP